MGRRVGIREVASAAGLSVTTVSHALNGKGRIPETTRERVRRIAEALDYRPNAAARNLVGGKTGLLGLAVSQLGEAPFAPSDFAYFGQLITAAASTAMDAGYALVLTPPTRSLEPGAGFDIDGAIIVDPVAGDPLASRLHGSGTRVVTTGRSLDDRRLDCWVDNDHAAGARSVLDHLARRGAERIALMTSPTKMSYTADVQRGYESWCAEHGVEPRLAVAHSNLTEHAGFTAASELLASSQPPDAIYATYDRLAYGALLAAEARGVRVPADLLLVTTATESEQQPQSRTTLTALNLHPERIGHEAAELLLELVEGREPQRRQVVVPTRITARASTRRRAQALT